MSFSRLFMAVSLILIYVIQKLFGLAHQASPVNLKPASLINDEDMMLDMRHLAFEDQLQFIDSDDYYKTDTKLLNNNEDAIQLTDSISVSYLSMSVLLFEVNERQGCLGAANYSVIRTFSAVNVGQMVLQIKGFRIGSSSSASNILRGRLYNIAKSAKSQHQTNHNNHQQQAKYHQTQPQSGKSICQGYGFTIYDCEPFDLEPNREHKIRIAFNPDFTLSKTIVSLTILTNLDEEFRFALVASIPSNLLTTCYQTLPRPDWEPTMHLILAIGIIIMILVSILTAYMEAMLYLKSQQATTAQLTNGHSVTQSNHHNHGGNSKDYERTNCSNHSNDTCNKNRSNGSGHGAASPISASISSHQQTSTLPFNALTNGSSKNHSNNNSNKNNSSNTNAKSSSSCTQKKRKNSSTTNNEKVPTSNKSIGSTNGDKKSSSSYAPIFQNLTNVIASPPPPLPTFDNEYDPLEFKKLRGKRSTKKSNSLNGSVASSDDLCNHNSLNQGQVATSSQSSKTKLSGKAIGAKLNGANSINGDRESDLQERVVQVDSHNVKNSLKDVFSTTSSSSSDEESCSDNIKLCNVDRNPPPVEQATVMPIQPPSSLSSTPSSSSSTTSSTTSSSSSSTSSSPPLSASSYGEYSLLGPGATFELPCLRVRPTQI